MIFGVLPILDSCVGGGGGAIAHSGLLPPVPLLATPMVRRQTYGYLPSRRASPPLGQYQIILLGDRGTWV